MSPGPSLWFILLGFFLPLLILAFVPVLVLAFAIYLFIREMPGSFIRFTAAPAIGLCAATFDTLLPSRSYAIGLFFTLLIVAGGIMTLFPFIDDKLFLKRKFIAVIIAGYTFELLALLFREYVILSVMETGFGIYIVSLAFSSVGYGLLLLISGIILLWKRRAVPIS